MPRLWHLESHETNTGILFWPLAIQINHVVGLLKWKGQFEKQIITGVDLHRAIKWNGLRCLEHWNFGKWCRSKYIDVYILFLPLKGSELWRVLLVFVFSTSVIHGWLCHGANRLNQLFCNLITSTINGYTCLQRKSRAEFSLPLLISFNWVK